MSNESLRDLWNRAKDLLKEETTVITYETWIQPLELQSINDNIIVLIATNSFQRDTVESRYIDLLPLARCLTLSFIGSFILSSYFISLFRISCLLKNNIHICLYGNNMVTKIGSK